MMHMKGSDLVFPLLLACCILFLSLGGCTPGHLRSESVLDTPKHHVSTGFRLLDKGRIADAEREFMLALHLNGSEATAQCGLGLVYGKKGKFLQALKSMEMAGKNAKTERDKALIYLGYMRIYTMQKGKDWLKKAEENFEDAVGMGAELPDAYFYLGRAYMEAYQFRKAEKKFNKVKELHARFVEEADRELKTVSKIIIARPGSITGKKIAILKRVTRAETAALLVEELKLDALLGKGGAKAYREPSASAGEAKEMQSFPLMSDWKNHPLKRDIDVIIELGIAGLKRAPDGSFLPDQNITRAEYAMAMADIIVSLKKDPTLATRFTRDNSPFSDVKSGESYFTAVMLCTVGTGIMEPRYGVFNPGGGMTGADALLVIRRLKEELRIY
ncbi:MAG: S-layer homology domain-containing protein [Desulfatiglandaceae bacterium]